MNAKSRQASKRMRDRCRVPPVLGLPRAALATLSHPRHRCPRRSIITLARAAVVQPAPSIDGNPCLATRAAAIAGDGRRYLLNPVADRPGWGARCGLILKLI